MVVLWLLNLPVEAVVWGRIDGFDSHINGVWHCVPDNTALTPDKGNNTSCISQCLSCCLFVCSLVCFFLGGLVVCLDD